MHFSTNKTTLCINSTKTTKTSILPNQKKKKKKKKKKTVFNLKKVFNLNAWFLSTDSSDHKAFLKMLENGSQDSGGLVHTKTMVANSNS